MEKFYRTRLTKEDINNDQSAMQLVRCVDLIAKSEYKARLLELIEFDTIAQEYVTIKGLRKIVSSIIEKDELYQKIDIDSHFTDVKYIPTVDSDQILLEFHNIENFDETTIQAETIYSAKGDYFDCFYKLERFANFCIANGHTALLKQNIEYLNNQYKEDTELQKKFRLLLDKEDKYYVRAITSTNRYFDYNIRFSLFVTIIALHKLKKEQNIDFEISSCEYDESFIKIFFEKSGFVTVPKVGKMSFMLEMSNDEIKREAFKFSSLISLSTDSSDGKFNLYLKPRRIETEFVSIRHNFTPDTVIERVSELNNFIKQAEEEMRDDIIDFSTVNNADQLRYKLLRKIEKSREPKLSDNNNSLKTILKQTLSQKIDRITELLAMMDKLDKIVTDLDVKEYLRYIFYEVLTKQKK